MNYQVLARKWRPHNFTEVVGQEHVVTSLINALQHDRLHHAYLFTGTRGVGKTTLARILAKAINCENLQNANPCGTCRVCIEVDEGRFLDLVEVDAASRTKVEDTRDLLDNAQYAPNFGRYKIYLIDEVHMLSGHSFNALLKTLEEPPPQVKFLLATTDPHKIPITVLSRCLQFNLKRLLPDQIARQMQFILQQEHLEFELGALKLLARAADGSMRDGLSLLDQAIVYGNGRVTQEQVSAMLGTVAQQPVAQLLTALAAQDAAGLFKEIEDLANLSTDFAELLAQMLRVLHRIAVVQQIPGVVEHEFEPELLAQLAGEFSAEDVQLFYQIGLLGQKELELAPDPRCGFEMVLLRMLTFKPVNPATEFKKPLPAKSAIVPVATPAEQSAAGSVPEEPITSGLHPEPDAEPEPAPVLNSSADWRSIIAALKIGGLTQQLAQNCILEQIDDKVCTLLLDAGHKQLRSAVTEDKLQKALEKYYRLPLKLVIKTEATAILDTPAAQLSKDREHKQQQAVEAINADPNILALKEHFDARVLPGSIEPV